MRDLGRLREVAEAARYEGQHWYTEEEFVGRWPECCDCGCPVLMGANRKAEASHIATFDPPTVLALLDRLEAAEAKVRRVEARCAQYGTRSQRYGEDEYEDGYREALADAQRDLLWDLRDLEPADAPTGHGDAAGPGEPI